MKGKSNKRDNKILLIIIMIGAIVLLFNSNTISAAINDTYSGADVTSDTDLDKSIKGSNILELLAKLIYAVGRLLEWVLGVIFKLLTGSSDFPWADKIVFNAVPLLDINFMNPANGSFVGNSSIQVVLQNLYSTIMALAVSFFGIAVLITAIKLLISTIASEKAKYKQAVIDWLVGFIMIFCIHYFISFVFYLNEQLVMVASRIVTKNLETIDVNIASVVYESYVSQVISDGEKLIGDKTLDGRKLTQDSIDVLKNNKDVLLVWLEAIESTDNSKGLHEAMFKKLKRKKDKNISLPLQYERLAWIIDWAVSENVSVDELQEIKNNIRVYYATALSCDKYATRQAILTSDIIKIFGSVEGADEFLSAIGYIDDLYYAYYGGYDQDGNKLMIDADYNPEKCGDNYIANKDENGNWAIVALSSGGSRFGYGESTLTEFYYTDVLDDLITLKMASDTNTGQTIIGSKKNIRIITDLASYFRYMAYGKEVRENTIGLKDDKNINIQNMIMYAVLVGQSLILFISYIKRLFYVIILAMMAPIIVVFDFFQKFAK